MGSNNNRNVSYLKFFSNDFYSICSTSHSFSLGLARRRISAFIAWLLIIVTPSLLITKRFYSSFDLFFSSSFLTSSITKECENHKACVTREGAIFTRHKDEECPIWNGDEGEAGVRQHCEVCITLFFAHLAILVVSHFFFFP